MLSTLKTYFSSNVAPALIVAGLQAMDGYIDTPPTDNDSLQFCVYLAEGTDSTTDKRDAFLIQVQLPTVLSPVPYLDVIWPIVEDFNPSLLGYDAKDISWQTWYPGELGDGYGGSFIYIEIEVSKSNDDCYLDDSLT
jgi:hypothetical protein